MVFDIYDLLSAVAIGLTFDGFLWNISLRKYGWAIIMLVLLFLNVIAILVN